MTVSGLRFSHSVIERVDETKSRQLAEGRFIESTGDKHKSHRIPSKGYRVKRKVNLP